MILWLKRDFHVRIADWRVGWKIIRTADTEVFRDALAKYQKYAQYRGTQLWRI
jgi:hypothetical protein